jgi:hypothetical protein
MKAKVVSYLTAGVLLATVATASSAAVSIAIGEPGFYGAISIGNAPAPVFLNQQPVMIQPAPVGMAPLYLRVRPQEQRDWRRYCRNYNACGRPVYFVDHNWYQKNYVPYYRSHRSEYNRRPDYGKNNNHGHGNRGYDNRR